MPSYFTPKGWRDKYKEYIQTTYTSQINYNYAALEPTFLSAIDFLTNGTVNRIICDDDRINCNFLAVDKESEKCIQV
jgi:predicted RNA-binding Zn ribbon-like protein